MSNAKKLKNDNDTKKKKPSKTPEVFILTTTLDGTRLARAKERKISDIHILKAFNQEELAEHLRKEHHINNNLAMAYLVRGEKLYITFNGEETKNIDFHEEFKQWEQTLNEIYVQYPNYESFRHIILGHFLEPINTDNSDKETVDLINKYKNDHEVDSEEYDEDEEVDFTELPWGIIRIQKELYDIIQEHYKSIFESEYCPDMITEVPSVNGSNGSFGDMLELEYCYNYPDAFTTSLNIMQTIVNESRMYEKGLTPTMYFDHDPAYAISIRLCLTKEKNRIKTGNIIYKEPKGL